MKEIIKLQLALIVLLFVSCKYDKGIRYSLELSGDNKNELEKVLVHYSKERGDSLKYRAALFLIENMQGKYSYDSTTFDVMYPIYVKHQQISQKYNWERTKDWEKEIDSMWKVNRVQLGIDFLKRDLQTVKSDWMINQIDLAFKAWKENAYSKDILYEDFCSYILPYRITNGIVIDDSRTDFYNKHKGCFSNRNKKITELIDSVLYCYKDLEHSNFSAVGLPVVSIKSFDIIKRGICEDRVWYNVSLFRSLGIPSSIDFVPNWGNRDNGHSWNVIVFKDTIHQFDPFWEGGNVWQKYSKLYNNSGTDKLWGKFRLGKVYRHFYEKVSTPLEKNNTDIHPFFRNENIKDVSKEYFETADLGLKLQCRDDNKYCYLCVYDKNRGFVPLEISNIKHDGSVLFKSMGKDVMYFPMYYKKDKSFTPAHNPVHLTEDGEIINMTLKENISLCLNTFTSSIVVVGVEKNIDVLNKMIIGASSGDNGMDTLKVLNDTIDTWYNSYDINKEKRYDKVKLIFNTSTIALSEIRITDMNGNIVKPFIKDSSNVRYSENGTVSNIIDGKSATGFIGNFTNCNCSVILSFNEPVSIKKIELVPYNFISSLDKDRTYTLQYWDNGWKAHGGKKLKNKENVISFFDVPGNTVYRLVSDNMAGRIFKYENGFVFWM